MNKMRVTLQSLIGNPLEYYVNLKNTGAWNRDIMQQSNYRVNCSTFRSQDQDIQPGI